MLSSGTVQFVRPQARRRRKFFAGKFFADRCFARKCFAGMPFSSKSCAGRMRGRAFR